MLEKSCRNLVLVTATFVTLASATVGHRLSGNGVDGDDQGTSNCWRGNRNPSGAALTGTIPTAGCP